MKYAYILATVTMIFAATTQSATAVEYRTHGSLKGCVAYRQAPSYSWNGPYYDVAWGMPVAVVVPPTAENQIHYGRTVGATRVTSIQHQYEATYPPESVFHRSRYAPTPAWPRDTDEFGDYYIRAPW